MKKFKKTIFLILFVSLTSCATVWKERDPKWTAKGKPALLASFVVKPGDKEKDVSLLTIAATAITEKDNHRFKPIGTKGAEILKGYFNDSLNMKIKFDKKRAKKLSSSKNVKIPKKMDAVVGLFAEN